MFLFCLEANVLQNTFFCVPQKKESHTGLDENESELRHVYTEIDNYRAPYLIFDRLNSVNGLYCCLTTH